MNTWARMQVWGTIKSALPLYLVSRYQSAGQNKGLLAASTINDKWQQHPLFPTNTTPPLDAIIIRDSEKAAQMVLSPKTWAYYSVGVNDEISLAASID